MDIAVAFRRLLQYLYSMGHRNFGFICGKPAEMQERYDEMHNFVKERGLNYSPSHQIINIDTFEESQVGVTRLLKNHPEITAIACTDDVLAVGAVMGAHDLGLRIPQDISITGFDDVPIGRFCFPRLTTVRIPIEDLGTISVNSLLDRIAGNPPSPVGKLPLEILIRESTTVPREKK
jgi:DNA-binding LacI/PurR family transcriptional regulator